MEEISRVSCQKGPTRNAYTWQIGPFWQDNLDMFSTQFSPSGLGLLWDILWTGIKAVTYV